MSQWARPAPLLQEGTDTTALGAAARLMKATLGSWPTDLIHFRELCWHGGVVLPARH